jgi:cytochrome c biogenesis factor
VEIAFRDMAKPLQKKKEVFTVEVSIKPLINLVWLGVILMVTGFFISIGRHRKDLL